MFGVTKKKTKKEEQIDRKIEYLLEAYRIKDEELMNKGKNLVDKEKVAAAALR